MMERVCREERDMTVGFRHGVLLFDVISDVDTIGTVARGRVERWFDVKAVDVAP